MIVRARREGYFDVIDLFLTMVEETLVLEREFKVKERQSVWTFTWVYGGVGETQVPSSNLSRL